MSRLATLILVIALLLGGFWLWSSREMIAPGAVAPTATAPAPAPVPAETAPTAEPAAQAAADAAGTAADAAADAAAIAADQADFGDADAVIGAGAGVAGGRSVVRSASYFRGPSMVGESSVEIVHAGPVFNCRSVRGRRPRAAFRPRQAVR